MRAPPLLGQLHVVVRLLQAREPDRLLAPLQVPGGLLHEVAQILGVPARQRLSLRRIQALPGILAHGLQHAEAEPAAARVGVDDHQRALGQLRQVIQRHPG